ncbi:collagen alpha-1(I) chain-like [Eublepharis macularius]|uniref:Collagen alpha-1(I) chain-like n=1 Tax=Eublepharis macularius TaxID=481883 RepID=A0AA97KHX6_EUBMA|nr:collagen alpha-1(I) chain-like [Eublepharis macularius]
MPQAERISPATGASQGGLRADGQQGVLGVDWGAAGKQKGGFLRAFAGPGKGGPRLCGAWPFFARLLSEWACQMPAPGHSTGPAVSVPPPGLPTRAKRAGGGPGATVPPPRPLPGAAFQPQQAIDGGPAAGVEGRPKGGSRAVLGGGGAGQGRAGGSQERRAVPRKPSSRRARGPARREGGPAPPRRAPPRPSALPSGRCGARAPGCGASEAPVAPRSSGARGRRGCPRPGAAFGLPEPRREASRRSSGQARRAPARARARAHMQMRRPPARHAPGPAPRGLRRGRLCRGRGATGSRSRRRRPASRSGQSPAQPSPALPRSRGGGRAEGRLWPGPLAAPSRMRSAGRGRAGQGRAGPLSPSFSPPRRGRRCAGRGQAESRPERPPAGSRRGAAGCAAARELPGPSGARGFPCPARLACPGRACRCPVPGAARLRSEPGFRSPKTGAAAAALGGNEGPLGRSAARRPGQGARLRAGAPARGEAPGRDSGEAAGEACAWPPPRPRGATRRARRLRAGAAEQGGGRGAAAAAAAAPSLPARLFPGRASAGAPGPAQFAPRGASLPWGCRAAVPCPRRRGPFKASVRAAGARAGRVGGRGSFPPLLPGTPEAALCRGLAWCEWTQGLVSAPERRPCSLLACRGPQPLAGDPMAGWCPRVCGGAVPTLRAGRPPLLLLGLDPFRARVSLPGASA